MSTRAARVTLAQIGCGYWGPNLLRNFSAIDGCHVKYLVEPSAERRQFAASHFPRTAVMQSVEDVLSDNTVDGVVIATPAASHFALAKAALRAGKHVLVEKPLAQSVEEVDQLAAFEASGLVVMVGHTFLYDGAIRAVRRLIEDGDLGDVRYIHSQRLNLGRIRSDVDALWNLAPHDISVIQYWLGEPTPIEVTRNGMSYVQDGIDDVVFLNVTYPNRVIANVHVSWLDPRKVRRMTVVGSKKMVVYDDIAEDTITILDKGIDRRAVPGEQMDFDDPAASRFVYRLGNVIIPTVERREPLRVQAEHFLECIRNGCRPLTGTAHARQVVSVLEQAGPRLPLPTDAHQYA